MRVSLSQENFLWARMAYSITLAVFVVRALHFFYEAKYTGPKIIMIGNMVGENMAETYICTIYSLFARFISENPLFIVKNVLLLQTTVLLMLNFDSSP